jgi:hypothetical protein
MGIVLDAATDGGLTLPGTSLTWSHTCSGANRILFVGVTAATGASDTVSGVTYNSVAMTRINTKVVPTDRKIYLYYLLAPSTGANDVVITTSTSDAIAGIAVSYTNVLQVSPIDVNTTNTGTGVTTLATSVTTTVDNDWTVLYTKSASVATVAGTNTTQRQTGSISTAMYDSNAALTPTGSKTLNVDSSVGSINLATCMAAFSPIPPYTLSVAQGSYTLTGFDVIINRSIHYILTVAQGSYTLTGQAVSFAYHTYTRYVNLVKNAVTPTNATKQASASMTNRSKNSITPTNQTKN